jgi:5-methylcytosine-specific restriction protein A
MNRALRICRKPGCTTLVREGYCEKHRHIPQEQKRQAWDELNKNKPEWKRRFYASAEWTRCSIIHRAREPLCRRCKGDGMITVAEMVHHNPDLDTLMEQGLNPLDDKYLESICFNHHQEELRKKRGVGCH